MVAGSSDQICVRIERRSASSNFDDFTAQTAGINTGDRPYKQPWQPQSSRGLGVRGAWDRRFWGGGDATITLRHYQYSQIEDRIGVTDPTGVVYDAPGDIGPGTEDEAAFTLTLPTDKLLVKNGQLTADATFRRFRPVTDLTAKGCAILPAQRPSDWERTLHPGPAAMESRLGIRRQRPVAADLLPVR